MISKIPLLKEIYIKSLVYYEIHSLSGISLDGEHRGVVAVVRLEQIVVFIDQLGPVSETWEISINF